MRSILVSPMKAFFLVSIEAAAVAAHIVLSYPFPINDIDQPIRIVR